MFLQVCCSLGSRADFCCALYTSSCHYQLSLKARKFFLEYPTIYFSTFIILPVIKAHVILKLSPSKFQIFSFFNLLFKTLVSFKFHHLIQRKLPDILIISISYNIQQVHQSLLINQAFCIHHNSYM